MVGEIAIRAATSGDVVALDGVDAAAWDTRSTPGPLPMPGSFAARLPLAGTLVAAATSIIGYATLADRDAARPPRVNARFADGGHDDGRDDAIVRSLAVHPEHRGRGVGAALLDAAHALARARGHARVRLFVLGSNAAALALYRKVGYQILVVFPGEFEIDGHRVDDVVMGRSL